MKNRIVLLTIFSLTTLFAFAQNSGVYLSASDFSSAKLAYEINCSTEKHKIKLNEFLNQDYITVVHDKQSQKLLKKEIFGYKDCDNLTYRFSDKSHYVIVNPTEEILLYKHTIDGSKNQKAEVHYYFSVSGAAISKINNQHSCYLVSIQNLDTNNYENKINLMIMPMVFEFSLVNA
ncbi:MAG: hypothetical protein ABIR06_03665 [Cyclobacteriaceae bacterium]